MIPVIILFAVEQLRVLLDDRPVGLKKKVVMVAYAIFIHIVFAIFLFRQIMLPLARLRIRRL